jgi:hypothetical protein
MPHLLWSGLPLVAGVKVTWDFVLFVLVWMVKGYEEAVNAFALDYFLLIMEKAIYVLLVFVGEEPLNTDFLLDLKSPFHPVSFECTPPILPL